jgi:hypothetical protein
MLPSLRHSFSVILQGVWGSLTWNEISGPRVVVTNTI